MFENGVDDDLVASAFGAALLLVTGYGYRVCDSLLGRAEALRRLAWNVRRVPVGRFAPTEGGRE